MAQGEQSLLKDTIAGSVALGGTCDCDADCAGDVIGDTTLSGVCYYGVCLQAFEGSCQWDSSDQSLRATDSTHCPANAQCRGFEGDTSHRSYCLLDCTTPEGEAACGGACDRKGVCLATQAQSNDFTASCDANCASFCNKQNSCLDYYLCVNYYDSIAETYCIPNDEQIASLYDAMTGCIKEHCSDAESHDAYLDCIDQHCRNEVDTCVPSIPEDGYCGPFETLENSARDCHICGDSLCTDSVETPENCAYDCAPQIAATCGLYYECNKRNDRCLSTCEYITYYASTAAYYECISRYCVACGANAEEQAKYQAMLTCGEDATNNCVSSDHAIDWSCIATHCEPELTECIPTAEDGDHVCSPNETLETSPADCHVCGDSICTTPHETVANCALDCAEDGPAHSTCNGAIDVSAGGDYPSYNFASGDHYTGLPGNDVFFTFELTEPTIVTLTTGPDSNQMSGRLTDTMLWVISGDCEHLTDSTVIASNDDFGTGTYSQLQLYLEAGVYYVVVESHYASSEGTFTLNVRFGCPAGQYQLNRGCAACTTIANCIEDQIICSTGSDSVCRACEEGYTPNDDGSACEPIPCDPIEHCAANGLTCDKDGHHSQCSACDEGYNPNDDGSACSAGDDIPRDGGTGTDGSISDSGARDSGSGRSDSGRVRYDATTDDEDADMPNYRVGGESACSAIPGRSSSSFLALLALPLLAIRRRRK